MRRTAVLFVVVLGVAETRPAAGCTFCGSGVQSRQTLREHFRQAKYVARGVLKNPRFDPNGGPGATELHVDRVLKADPAVGDKAVVVLPRYLPVIGNTPPDYLVFCTIADGKPDPLHGTPATTKLAEYLAGAAQLDDKDPVKRLGYFFPHLGSADKAIAADAFLEFAKAPDADILKAKAALDPATLRRLLSDPDVPTERVGVFAMMLGACGGKADAEALAGMLKANPLPEKVRENLGGLLAGLTLLDPAAGWVATDAVLTDPKRPFDQRLSAIGTVRFFQATRADEAKPHVLKCYKGLLAHGDLSDMAVDDLRRWKWWDLTADVLAPFGQPTHSAPLVRRGIVRYALQCPGEEAKRFVDKVRAEDPKLVAAVEETLKLYDPPK
jgi:hypothetical protein